MTKNNENLLNRGVPVFSLNKNGNGIITFPNGMKILVTIDPETKERVETIIDNGRYEL